MYGYMVYNNTVKPDEQEDLHGGRRVEQNFSEVLIP